MSKDCVASIPDVPVPAVGLGARRAAVHRRPRRGAACSQAVLAWLVVTLLTLVLVACTRQPTPRAEAAPDRKDFGNLFVERPAWGDDPQALPFAEVFRIRAWRIDPEATPLENGALSLSVPTIFVLGQGGYPIRSPARVLSDADRATCTDTLDGLVRSRRGPAQKLCDFAPGIALEITGRILSSDPRRDLRVGQDAHVIAHALVCFHCNTIRVGHALPQFSGMVDFDAVQPQLLALCQRAFPDDAELAAIPPRSVSAAAPATAATAASASSAP